MGRFRALLILLLVCFFATPALSESHGFEGAHGGWGHRPVAPETEPTVPITVSLFTRGQKNAENSIRLTVKPKTEYQELVVGTYLIRVWLFQKDSDGLFRASVAVWDKATRSALPILPYSRAIPPGRSLGSLSNAGREPKFLEDVRLEGEIKDSDKILHIAIGGR